RVLLTTRSFFGTSRVADRGEIRVLVHDTTVHGAQSLIGALRGEPLTYYARSSPIGDAFTSFAGYRSKFHVASIGLGAGTMATYAQPYQDWTFFEINPTVIRIATDPKYFTYLRDCRAQYKVVEGDARLEIAREPDGRFDVMIFDAFS